MLGPVPNDLGPARQAVSEALQHSMETPPSPVLLAAWETLSHRPERVVLPYAWAGHLPFVFALCRLLRPELIVELGTHSGNSFCGFCQAVESLDLGCRCVAVDSWYGDPTTGHYADGVYEELSDYVQRRYPSFAELKRCRFDDALGGFADASVDLLHIDGLHTYEGVRHDFETWLPKLSDRGVVLLHDICVFERNFGVHRLWSELCERYPGFAFPHSHGLGLLLVGAHPAPELERFVRAARAEPRLAHDLFFAMSLVVLPPPAAAYVQRVRLAAEADVLPKTVLVELFQTAGETFSEQDSLMALVELAPGRTPAPLDVEFPVRPEVRRVRLDPGFEAIRISATVRASAALADRTELPLTALDSNHRLAEHGDLIFDDDPQLTFAVPVGTRSVRFALSVSAVGDPVVARLLRELHKVQQDHEWYRGGGNKLAQAYRAAVSESDRLRVAFGDKLRWFRRRGA